MIYGVIILAAILAQPAFSVNLKARFRTGCGFVNAVVEDCGYMTVSAAYGAIAIPVAGMAFIFIRTAILTFPRVGCNRSKLPIAPVVGHGFRRAADTAVGMHANPVILPVAVGVLHGLRPAAFADAGVRAVLVVLPIAVGVRLRVIC